MKTFFLKCAVNILRVIYLPIKQLAVKEKVTYISRQSNAATLDIQRLSEEVEVLNPCIKQVILAKKIDSKLISKIRYIFHMLFQMYHIATTKVIILDGYCIAVSALKHKKETIVVQMWHALGAIKKFGYQTMDKPSGHSSNLINIMCMHCNYDYVLCASEASAEFFCEGFRIEEDKIQYLGLPRIDYILKENPRIKKEISRAYPDLMQKQTILYAPTFREGKVDQRKYSWFEDLDFSQYSLVIKLHPLDNVDRDLIEKPGVYFDTRFDLYDWMRYSDIIVTDYSSIGIEASLLEKRVFFFVYDIDRYKESTGLNMDFYTEAISNSTFQSGADLLDALSRPYDHEGLKAFRQKYITVNEKNHTKKLATFINNLMQDNN